MCGIAGIYNFKNNALVSKSVIDSMCEVIKYRGPDGYGTFVENNIGLGHRRLSIIDTSERSNQPMLSPDKSTVICYNGEIYNYLELKEALVQKGAEFHTTSDTEVLIQSFIYDGISSISRFNGMFAFALWDKEQQQLLLVRDRVGIKPLYYALTDDGIVFGSEIKSLFTTKAITPQVNKALIDSYMSLGYCPTDETLFHNIYKLPPGSYLKIKDGKVEVKQYWDMIIDDSNDRGEEYYITRSRELFEDAVKLQLRSDVPLGVFLSGGIDSSAVVAMMNKLGVSDIKTFSVAWDYGKNYNETDYSRKVAKQFETDHTEYFMTADDFRDFLPDYIRHMDEPVTEAAAISLYYLSIKAREKVTVVLSGEGADEVYGGYPIYKYFQIIEYYKYVPKWIRTVLLNPLIGLLGGKWKKYIYLSGLPLEQCYAGVSFYDTQIKESLYTRKFSNFCKQNNVFNKLKRYYEKSAGEHLQKRMQYLDIKTWLVDDLLIKADRMSMAASLELRVPFLDHRLLDFVAKMPARYRIKNFQNKYILKKAMEPFLDREILYRKKQGFPTPLSIMFKGELYDFVSEIIDCKKTHDRGYFEPAKVTLLLDDHKSGRKDNHRILWQLLVLELWHREFIDEK